MLKNVTAFFFTPASQAQIDTIAFDCSVEESHGFTTNVTDYPQENGFYMQDNIWIEPFKLTLKGIVTDTRLQPVTKSIGVLETRVGEVYNSLLALRDKRQVFEVMTGLEIYPDMVFSSLTVERDADTGFSIRIIAELKHIRKVSAQNNINKDSTPNKSFPNNNNNGTQQLQPVNDPGLLDYLKQYGIIS